MSQSALSTAATSNPCEPPSDRVAQTSCRHFGKLGELNFWVVLWRHIEIRDFSPSISHPCILIVTRWGRGGLSYGSNGFEMHPHMGTHTALTNTKPGLNLYWDLFDPNLIEEIFQINQLIRVYSLDPLLLINYLSNCPGQPVSWKSPSNLRRLGNTME